jgi:hypothetical protein
MVWDRQECSLREILICLRLQAQRPEEERSVEPTENLGVQCSMILLQKKIPADAESRLLLYFYGIFRSMICNLKTEECMDCLQSF